MERLSASRFACRCTPFSGREADAVFIRAHFDRLGSLGWAKARSRAVPTKPQPLVGTLRFAHPTLPYDRNAL